MAFVDFVGVAPWVVVTSVATWIASLLTHRRGLRKMELDHQGQLDMSRDSLAIELLSSARAEVVVARAEMGELREEITSLRAMEQHFYHFQQALDHLSAVLCAVDRSTRVIAERNARAFLIRMKRLQDAKGTIVNEVQIQESTISVAERIVKDEK